MCFVMHKQTHTHTETHMNTYTYTLFILKCCAGIQIIDSIMALFRVDFSGRGELADRQQKLAQLLSRLQKISEGKFCLLLWNVQLVQNRSYKYFALCKCIINYMYQCNMKFTKNYLQNIQDNKYNRHNLI